VAVFALLQSSSMRHRQHVMEHLMTGRLAPVISDDDIVRFEADGAICLRGVISPAWLEQIRDATEAILAGETINMSRQGAAAEFVGDVNVWAKHDGFATYAFEGPTAHIAATLMRSSSVRLYGDQLFVKAPGSQSPTPWHQDQPYWPVTGEDICSIWVPMEAVTRATSGLEYVKGSHRWGRRFDPQDFGVQSVAATREAANEPIPDFDGQRHQFTFLNWDMEPGDALVHNGLTVHGSGGNSSLTARRRAISTRWLGDRSYFRPSTQYQPELMGLEPGAPMRHPMFPVVPRNGEPIVPRPIRA
jgi:ectoine hydroxylase-related dioxygenase (phytanoyl-CoA dioxygenase family)